MRGKKKKNAERKKKNQIENDNDNTTAFHKIFIENISFESQSGGSGKKGQIHRRYG